MPFSSSKMKCNKAYFQSFCVMLFAAIFLFAASKQANAQLQELDRNPISVDEDIPVFPNHPEMAVIIIRSSLTNLTFDSNMLIIEEIHDPAAGEYILIIEPVTQTIRINAPGFLTERIPVRGYTARQVVYYSIEPAARETDDTIPVVIRVEPVDARVEYDGEVLDLSRSILLEPGSHTITIAREHHRTRTETISVNIENTFFEFELEPLNEQVVRIETEPAGAMIFVDDVEQGVTDRTGVMELFRFPGTYGIEVILSGYQRIQKSIEVSEDGENTFDFNLEPSTSTLALNVEPETAEVRWNRQQVGGNETLEVAAGTYRLEVTLDGHEPYSETINIARGEHIERTITLQEHTGTLLYSVSPSFAQSTLQDSEGNVFEQWNGSQRLEVKTGEWVLTVRADGYEPRTETLQIAHNQTLEHRAVLTEVITETEPETDFSFPESTTEISSTRSVLSVGLLSSFLNNQTFRTNYKNGYGVQLAFKFFPLPYLFAEVNTGYVYHGFERDHPYYESGQSIYNLFGGITAGWHQNLSPSTDLNLGLGYRTSAYNPSSDTNFDEKDAQAFNTFYAEGGVALAIPGINPLTGLGLYFRYGFASNIGNEPLIEYGIRLQF